LLEQESVDNLIGSGSSKEGRLIRWPAGGSDAANALGGQQHRKKGEGCRTEIAGAGVYQNQDPEIEGREVPQIRR